MHDFIKLRQYREPVVTPRLVGFIAGFSVLFGTLMIVLAGR